MKHITSQKDNGATDIPDFIGQQQKVQPSLGFDFG
tara:strand:+ start:5509 stop:5613 length:105 start_codon:yes stop_codon:yes gene_type:complete